MRIEGKISEQDYLRGTWLQLKPRLEYRVFGYGLLALLGVMYIAAAVGLFVGIWLKEFSGAFSCLLFLVIIPLMLANLRWQAQRSYRRQTAFQSTFSYEITDSGIVATSSLGREEADWTEFAKWREDAQLFLLFQPATFPLILPKRWFSDAGRVAEFRRVLESKPIARIGSVHDLGF